MYYHHPVMRTPRRYLLLCALAVLLPSAASAVPISILDCNGVTRATKNLDTVTRADVQIDVTTPNGGTVDGVNVSLTNTATGEVVTTTVVDGVAAFAAVEGGTWVMGSATSDLLYSTIILETEVSAVAAFTGAAGAGVVGGGAVYGVVEGVDSMTRSGKDDPAIPQPTPEPNPQPTPPPAPTPVCTTCNPDEDADEIDDFFNQQKEPGATAAQPVVGSRVEGQKTISPAARPAEKRLNPDDCFIGDEVVPMSPFR